MRGGIRTSCSVVAATVAGAAIMSIASGAAQGPPKTVLDGIFTAPQAERGADVYDAECASCHEGADVDGPPLAGDPFIDRWREGTLENLFEFIKTRMPQTAPGSLSEAASVDILAYLLHENSYQAGPRELTRDALASTLVVGPNGPQPLPNGALVRVVGCLAQSPSREWIITRAGRPSRVSAGNEITASETSAATGAGPGGETFTLQNVGEGGIALPGTGTEGQKVIVKGALTQRAGAARIHVTAARSVAATCV
jgi:mono/diheme cytochrome c family protein